jgi:hypothetical protein
MPLDQKSRVTHLSPKELFQNLEDNMRDPKGPHVLKVFLKEDRSDYPRTLFCDIDFPRTNMKQAWLFSTDGPTAGVVTSQEAALKLITLWLAKEHAHLLLKLSDRWEFRVRNVPALLANMQIKCDNLLHSDARTFLLKMMHQLSQPSAHDLIKANIWLNQDEPHPDIIHGHKLFY